MSEALNRAAVAAEAALHPLTEPGRTVMLSELARAAARAAIEAIREPSRDMQDAGGSAPGGCDPGCNCDQVTLRPLVIWQAMIDEALGPAPKVTTIPHRGVAR